MALRMSMHSASGLNHRTRTRATEQEAQGELSHLLTLRQHCLHTHTQAVLFGSSRLLSGPPLGDSFMHLPAHCFFVSCSEPMCVWERCKQPGSEGPLRTAASLLHTITRPASSPRQVCQRKHHEEDCIPGQNQGATRETHQSCRMFLSTYAVQLLSAGGDGTVAASNMSPGTSSTRGSRWG